MKSHAPQVRAAPRPPGPPPPPPLLVALSAALLITACWLPLAAHARTHSSHSEHRHHHHREHHHERHHHGHPQQQQQQQQERNEQLGSCGLAPRFGKTDRAGQERVAHATDAGYGEFPAFVSVIWNTTQRCGGVLLSPVLVLTAAQCAITPEGRDALPEELSLYVGDHEPSKLDAHERVHYACGVCVAPKYRAEPTLALYESEHKHDWAIITLERPVEFNERVQSACLPARANYSELPAWGPESNCYAMGMGITGPKRGPNNSWARVLQKLRVERYACGGVYPIKDGSDESRICAQAAKGQPGNVCWYDTGSPILCRDTKGLWNVLALASYGPARDCRGAGHERWLGVFTEARRVLDDMKQCFKCCCSNMQTHASCCGPHDVPPNR